MGNGLEGEVTHSWLGVCEIAYMWLEMCDAYMAPQDYSALPLQGQAQHLQHNRISMTRVTTTWDSEKDDQKDQEVQNLVQKATGLTLAMADVWITQDPVSGTQQSWHYDRSLLTAVCNLFYWARILSHCAENCKQDCQKLMSLSLACRTRVYLPTKKANFRQAGRCRTSCHTAEISYIFTWLQLLHFSFLLSAFYYDPSYTARAWWCKLSSFK